MRAVQTWDRGFGLALVSVMLLACGLSACDQAQIDASGVSDGTRAVVPDTPPPAGGGEGGPGNRPAVTRMISAATGGTIASSDGLLMLDIPAGALPSDTAITIRDATTDDLVRQTNLSDIVLVYELLPDGLQFQQPVTISITRPVVRSESDVRLELGRLGTETSDGVAEIADALTISAGPDSGTVTFTGEISHFSHAIYEARPGIDIVFRHPGALFSGDEGVLRLVLDGDDGRGPVRLEDREDFDFAVEAPYLFTGSLGSSFDSDSGQEVGFARGVSCAVDGETRTARVSARGVVSIEVEARVLDRPFLTDDAGTPVRVDVSDFALCVPRPAEPTVGIPRTFANLSPELGNGQLDAFTGFGFEGEPGFSFEGASGSSKGTSKTRKPDVARFADFGTGPFGLFSSGEGSVGGINLLDGSVVFNADLSASGFTPFGVAAMTSPPGGPETRAAIVAYGNAGAGNSVAGSLRVYRAQPSPPGFPTRFAFTNAANIEADFVLDATNTGGGVLSAAIVVAGSHGVTFVRPDQNAGFFHDTRGLDIGPVFSAFRLEDTSVGGSTMVLQDSAELGPLIRRAQSNVFSNELASIETVGATGPNPRKLRCIPDFCAASHNGEADVAASGITWFAWDGFGSVDFPDGGTADFGTASPIAGTIGIDVRELPNGNYGVVGTGFNNNMVYEVEVNASDLSFVRQVETPAPTGCENPGHAQWFEDARGLGYLLSCFGGGYAADDAHIGAAPAQH